MLRRVLIAVCGAVLLASMTVAAAHAAPDGPAIPAVVGVSVATVWTSPDSPRELDAPAVGNPADPAGWLASMSEEDRLDLTTASRTQTQVLYGARVLVLEQRDGWSRVVVPGQPSAKDARGYPGWIPSVQLLPGGTGTARAPQPPTGTVDGVATTWLYTDPDLAGRLREISLGTRLAVRAERGRAVEVALPEGGTAWADARHVRIGDGGEQAVTGAGVVATAELMLDRPYLWGGRSGFAADCSGLTGLAYELHGVTIGRDASDQQREGRPVDRHDLRPGDLLFWNSPATHVAIYAGGGKMVEAYDAATPVRVAPVRFDASYSGARRILP